MHVLLSIQPISRFSRPLWLGGGLLVLLLSSPTQGGAADTAPADAAVRSPEKDPWARVWDAFRLYDNQQNPVIQSFSLIGRYHGQYWSVNADQGRADGWDNRRFYAGIEADLYHDYSAAVQAKFGQGDPSLYEAFVQWSPDRALALRLGRLDYLFTGLERTVSSKKIATFERGLLVNQLLPREVVGALVSGGTGEFSYFAGLFSGSINDGLTDFAGGYGVVAGVGHELPLFYETGSLHLDYLHHDGQAENNAFAPYDHVLSLWHQGRIGAFGLGVDLTTGHGLEGRKPVFGVTLLPTWVLRENLLRSGDALEAVFRYQYATSDGENGLQLQERYEQEVGPGEFGNSYQAFYAGINYLVHGDRFKLMAGTEYAVMKDTADDGGSFRGWTHQAGVRVYF